MRPQLSIFSLRNPTCWRPHGEAQKRSEHLNEAGEIQMTRQRSTLVGRIPASDINLAVDVRGTQIWRWIVTIFRDQLKLFLRSTLMPPALQADHFLLFLGVMR